MRHIVAACVVAIVLTLALRSPDVNGQVSCSFVGGFARLRDLVGAEKVGACLDDEHLNMETGNVEQHASGGLLVWRKVDNVTAFTDGGTTWLNGPKGLESRANDERLAWELDPVAPPAPVTTSAPPPPLPAPAPPPPAPVAQASETLPPPSPSPLPPSVQAVASPAASTTANAAQQTGASTSSGTASSGTSSAALSSAPSVATPTPTPTKVPTATPTPTVSVKFIDKPDDVDAGTDAHFEVQTNAKSGTCNLTITYRDSSIVGLGAKAIDDGRCSWTFNVPATTKAGKAKAAVTVSGSNGSASADDSFTVREGDTVYGGNVELEIEDVDLPDEVTVGQEVKVSVDTNVTRNKGRCELQIAWPGYPAFTGDSMATDDRGRCSWKTTVPAAIPAKGTATLTLTVRKSSVYTRTVTKQFDVKK